MNEPHFTRRTHFTPRWKLLARAYLPSIICGLAISTFVFGLTGFVVQYLEFKNEPPVADISIPIYKTIQLFLLNSGAEDDADSHPKNTLLAVARGSAALLVIVISGAAIWRLIENIRALPRHLMQSDHILICGLGQIGLQLLDDLDKRGEARKVVIIERDAQNPWLDYARDRDAEVIIGDAARADTLNEARVAYAKQVFAVMGDDGLNLEVAAEVGSAVLKRAVKRTTKLQLFISIYDVQLASTLRPFCPSLQNADGIEVHVFNVPRSAAVRMVTHGLWEHAPKKEGEVAHYVILGFGSMGQALAVQLAQLGHFPNRKRSRFTIADHNIRSKSRTFISHFSRFSAWTDDLLRPGNLKVDADSDADEWWYNKDPLPQGIAVPGAPDAIQYVCNAEYVNLPGGRADERFAHRMVGLFSKPNVKPVVFVCGSEDRDNFDVAVQLGSHFANLGRPDIPIFVWLPRQPALAEALRRRAEPNAQTELASQDNSSVATSPNGWTVGDSTQPLLHFLPFGEWVTAAGYTEVTEPIREKIGRKLHENYCEHAVRQNPDSKQHAWADLRDEFRESSRIAADHVFIKMKTLEMIRRSRGAPMFPIDELDEGTPEEQLLLAEMEHNRWVAERLLAGWRYAPAGSTSGETTANKLRKLNHTLVPWQKLRKDRHKDLNQITAALREIRDDGFDCRTDSNA
jgi:voltage-gated potassium channel Kch